MKKSTEIILKRKEHEKPRTPLLDSLEKEINRRKGLKELEGKRLKFLFIGRTIASGIITEIKKVNGGRAQAIDGGVLFGLQVHVMRNGKPEQVDIC